MTNCKVCKNVIFSTGVTLETIDGTETLVIDIPAATYGNCCHYCLIVTQAIPTDTPISAPVSISIGGDTTVVYPVVNGCSCAQVTACSIRTRTKYPVLVSTSATGGVFKVLSNLSCAPNNNLPSLPVPAAPAAGA